jgi:SAM-dependent methyltransferase
MLYNESVVKGDFKKQLEAAYDADAERRAVTVERDPWKLELREIFARQAKAKDLRTVLEIGSGDGFDAAYLQAQEFDVLATDLSAKMVEQCKKRELPAVVADVYQLDKLGRRFDAVYSMNVLLHVPKQDVLEVLRSIGGVMNIGGLFFLGVYGGFDREEVKKDPNIVALPRFFSFLSDEALLEAATSVFEVVNFEAIKPRNFYVGGKERGFHFQALMLQKAD